MLICARHGPTSLLKTKDIVDEVSEEMKIAMKAKDKVTLQTIRLMRTAFANRAIDLRKEKLNDGEVSFCPFKKGWGGGNIVNVRCGPVSHKSYHRLKMRYEKWPR